MIVETLQHQYAGSETGFDDLDALAGAWNKAEAEAFAVAIAPFAEIDSSLWAAEPKSVYRVTRASRRRPGK